VGEDKLFSLIIVQNGKGVLEDVKADIFTEKHSGDMSRTF